MILAEDCYRPNSVNNDVSDLYPAFQGQNFKESQHSIADIVKVKISRICPGKSEDWLIQSLVLFSGFIRK